MVTSFSGGRSRSTRREPGFIYVSSEGRVGCEFLHPAQPTDAPSSRRSFRSHFYTPGLTPFRGLVPLGRRNLVPILPPAHPLGGGLNCIWEHLEIKKINSEIRDNCAFYKSLRLYFFRISKCSKC